LAYQRIQINLMSIANIALIWWMLTIPGCQPGFINSGLPREEPCFGGFYSDAQVTLRIVHSAGEIGGSGWPRNDSEDSPPWTGFSIHGETTAQTIGEAVVDIDLYFEGSCPRNNAEICTPSIEDVRFHLVGTENEYGCLDHLSFNFSYRYEGRLYTETHALERRIE